MPKSKMNKKNSDKNRIIIMLNSDDEYKSPAEKKMEMEEDKLKMMKEKAIIEALQKLARK